MDVYHVSPGLLARNASSSSPSSSVANIAGNRSRCNWCDFTSVSQMMISTHERALHSAEMSASFFCTFCPAKLSSAVGLHLHASRKHGVSHLPGWPSQLNRRNRDAGGTSEQRDAERVLGDGWVVGDTREGVRVQYKADFYVNAFHTVGEGYVRLELLGPQRSASGGGGGGGAGGAGGAAGQSNPGYLQELNRLLEESATTLPSYQDLFEELDANMVIDASAYRHKLIDPDAVAELCGRSPPQHHYQHQHHLYHHHQQQQQQQHQHQQFQQFHQHQQQHQLQLQRQHAYHHAMSSVQSPAPLKIETSPSSSSSSSSPPSAVDGLHPASPAAAVYDHLATKEAAALRNSVVDSRGENRPPKEYSCTACAFRTKYSSSLRRHTFKMHKMECKK